MAQMKMLRQVMSLADIYTHADMICEMLRDHYGSYDADSLDEVPVDETFVQRLGARGYDLLPEGAVVEDRPTPPPPPSRREFPRAEIGSAPPRRIVPSNGSGPPLRRQVGSEGDSAVPLRRREPSSDGESAPPMRRRPMPGEQEPSSPMRRRPAAGESSLPLRRPAPGSDGGPFRQRIAPSAQPSVPFARQDSAPPAAPLPVTPEPVADTAAPASVPAPSPAPVEPAADVTAPPADAVASDQEQVSAPFQAPAAEVSVEVPMASAQEQPSSLAEAPAAPPTETAPVATDESTPAPPAKPAPRKRVSRAKTPKPEQPE